MTAARRRRRDNIQGSLSCMGCVVARNSEVKLKNEDDADTPQHPAAVVDESGAQPTKLRLKEAEFAMESDEYKSRNGGTTQSPETTSSNDER